MVGVDDPPAVGEDRDHERDEHSEEPTDDPRREGAFKSKHQKPPHETATLSDAFMVPARRHLSRGWGGSCPVVLMSRCLPCKREPWSRCR